MSGVALDYQLEMTRANSSLGKYVHVNKMEVCVKCMCTKGLQPQQLDIQVAPFEFCTMFSQPTEEINFKNMQKGTVLCILSTDDMEYIH